MRVVVQRVSSASVRVDEQTIASIASGLLVLAGIEEADDQRDADWLAKKIVALRIFSDEAGKMNRSVKETGGDLLIVSQFTLHALTEKGNRPSFIKAARPEQAIPLYEYFIKALQLELGKNIQSGKFGADMKVQLVNDGPVTLWMDSKKRE